MTMWVGVPMCFLGEMLWRYLGWLPATFLATFFLVEPQPAGNGNLVGVWPILGLWHSEKFRARAQNTKTQFPGTRGSFMGGKCCHAIRDGFPQLSRESLFLVGPPLAGNGYLVVFGPSLAHFQVTETQNGPKYY